MKFLDLAKVYIRSGSGGGGCISFRREKFIEYGGPDGGDGGRGGHITIQGNDQMWTLLHLKYQKHLFAEHGGSGSSAAAPMATKLFKLIIDRHQYRKQLADYKEFNI